MRKSIIIAATALLGLGASACTTGTHVAEGGVRAATRVLAVNELTFVSHLRAVGDCDALLVHLKGEASARVGPYGLGIGGGPFLASTAGGPAAVARDAQSTAATPSSPAAPAATDYSTTNVQELGVDEPDLVKSDGKRVVTITNGVLSVIDIAATPPARTGSVKLGDDHSSVRDLLIVGDKALVFGSSWEIVPGATGTSVGKGVAAPLIRAPGASHATVTEVDLRDSAHPKVGATLRVDGGYLTARLVGTTARVVIRSEPRNLEFVYPQNPTGDKRATELNRQVIEETTIENWLPRYELAAPDGKVTSKGTLTDCRRVEAPSEFAGFGALSVLTFDLTKSLGTGDAVSVLAGGDTVYASASSLYVATTSYVEPSDAAKLTADFATSIHAFDISGTAPARYLASGNVPGHLLNQFAMSEHQGKLRAATTKGAPWGSPQAQSESLITVLERHGEQLDQIGQVANMGRGERIYSVRYDGDVAYVVTFRQTDPFYTVDLSDPAKPAVVGELKIPGFSSYLHPIGDHLVIGVGQGANEQGRVQGAKVSLFDVANLAAPTELASWTLPNSISGAQWDHHAFLWWPATKTLVLPVTQWAAGFGGAVVLHIERSGITEEGRITHDAVAPAPNNCGKPVPLPADRGGSSGASASPSIAPCPAALTPIVRSLVAGPTIWTLSSTTLQANALSGLARTAVIDLR